MKKVYSLSLSCPQCTVPFDTITIFMQIFCVWNRCVLVYADQINKDLLHQNFITVYSEFCYMQGQVYTRLTEPRQWCNCKCAGFECGVDRGFEKTRIGICCFSAKHTALRRKSRDWLARNQDNVSEWGNISTRALRFLPPIKLNATI